MRKYLVLLVLAICCFSACGKNEKKEDAIVNNTENIITENENGTEISVETKIEVTTESESESQMTEIESESDEIIPSYTYIDLNKVMYAKSSVNVRDLPSTDGNKLGGLSWSQEITVTGQCNETSWYRINYNGVEAYVSNNYLVDTKPLEETAQTNSSSNAMTWYDEEGFYYVITDTYTTPYETFYTGYVVSPVTGWTIILKEDLLEYSVNRLAKDLANAGYYVPVCKDNGNGYYCYYMLIKNPDESFIYHRQLEQYAIEQGGGMYNGGGGNWSGMKDANGNSAYLIYADIKR